MLTVFENYRNFELLVAAPDHHVYRFALEQRSCRSANRRISPAGFVPILTITSSDLMPLCAAGLSSSTESTATVSTYVIDLADRPSKGREFGQRA